MGRRGCWSDGEEEVPGWRTLASAAEKRSREDENTAAWRGCFSEQKIRLVLGKKGADCDRGGKGGFALLKMTIRGGKCDVRILEFVTEEPPVLGTKFGLRRKLHR